MNGKWAEHILPPDALHWWVSSVPPHHSTAETEDVPTSRPRRVVVNCIFGLCQVVEFCWIGSWESILENCVIWTWWRQRVRNSRRQHFIISDLTRSSLQIFTISLSRWLRGNMISLWQKSQSFGQEEQHIKLLVYVLAEAKIRYTSLKGKIRSWSCARWHYLHIDYCEVLQKCSICGRSAFMLLFGEALGESPC